MNIKEQLGTTDIYLIDQILKGRINREDSILDAGCGKGRNLHWFYKEGFNIHGVDLSPENVEFVKRYYPNFKGSLKVSDLTTIDHRNEAFNYIICSAVLHFAKSEDHFLNMISELVRVLDENGILFIRMTSNFEVKDEFAYQKNGQYILRDGSTRFLLTQDLLDTILTNLSLNLIEPIKTTNVDNLRCMTTLVFRKGI